ncbi:hypothetical protein ACSBR1_019947 [Camellia fascicularis]
MQVLGYKSKMPHFGGHKNKIVLFKGSNETHWLHRSSEAAVSRINFRFSSSKIALFGLTMPTDVGLRLLLCPLDSNIVVRTACCSVGVVLPVYSTFKAIESKNQNEQQRWLLYWAAYGSFSIAEIFTDKFISWFPLYYHVKFAFLVWLQLPSVNAKFVSAHQTEIQFARTLFMKIFGAVNQVVGDFFHPGKKQANGAIEGPTTNVQTQPDSVIESLTTQEQNSESESDE